MTTCPFCNTILCEVDLQTGGCPNCRRAVLTAEAGQGQVDTGGPESSGATAVPPLEEPNKGTADEQRVAETLFMGVVPVSPATDLETGTADERRIAQTLESGFQPAPPAGQQEESPADSHRYAETCDSGSISSDVIAQQVSSMWAGKFPSAATPRTSIKAEAQTVQEEANLVIQPRIVRDQKADAEVRADYELLSRLGEGGMGVVHAARQSSIDRTVAVKMLKPAAAKDPESCRKFLSEAVVTGDLEHPNIVPIYDLGKDESGALFYSMKCVKGTPWNAVIAKRTSSENQDIFLKIADAVAFAHSRGVVHRDLKPENVMLGDFGEVLLMDWGLALCIGSPAVKNAGMAGTPAYMAPEMAVGPIERIGFASDVYLLGAILYEIITLNPPHRGGNVVSCLLAAAHNEIQPTEKSGELVGIALKAMATRPEDRYPGVAELQKAIRDYQSHSESISLSTRAEEDLAQAKEHENYETYARALFGFQEAAALWEGNARARGGIEETGLAYAKSALRKGDYDLGASLLDARIPEHSLLMQEIKAARRERDARQQRLRTAKRVGLGLVATVFVVITVAFFWISAERRRAEIARVDAVNQREKAQSSERTAIAQKKEADKQKENAVKSQQVAVTEKDNAKRAQQTAEEAQRQEEYGAYIARIGLAAAKIEENAFDRASTLLKECPPYLRHWEWARLMHLCTQDIETLDARQPLDAVACSPDGKRFATGGWDGAIRIWTIGSSGKVEAEPGPQTTKRELLKIVTGGQYVFALAFSPDGKHVAAGTNDRPNYIKIWDAETGRRIQELPGHKDAVLSAAYSRDGKRLLTSSYDRTARLWNLETGKSQVFQGHEWWVWSAAFSPDEKRIITACQDGSVIVWSAATGQAGPPFLGHSGPVYAAMFSPDGKYAASAGYDNRILIWKPDQVKSFDFGALAGGKRAVAPTYEAMEGHTAGVRSIQFCDGGRLLVSGSYDNTLRVWDVAAFKLIKTLRGHAGRVTSVVVFDPAANGGPEKRLDRRGDEMKTIKVLSGSHDHTAKIWNVARYEEVRVLQGRVFQGHRDAILGAAFSPDGRQIISASRDRTARTWDVGSGTELRLFKEGHDYLATSAFFFPDGKRILTAAVDNTARIWDVATGSQILVIDGTGPSAAVALSHDATRILTGSDDKTAKLINAETGSLIRRFIGHHSEVTAVGFSPDDRLLLTGDVKGRCCLWDAATSGLKWQSTVHSRGITAAFFLPGGDYVLTASLDKTVAQLSVATGRERSSWGLAHPDAVTAMALSPDGRQVLTACADKVVRLWNVATGAQIETLATGGETINAVTFAPDGRRAATTSSNGTTQLWDLSAMPGAAPGSGGRSPLQSLKVGAGMAWSTVFSPDGDYLLTVGGNEARLWDTKTARERMRFSPHGAVASVRFSPDGKRIVTGSWDNTARIWNVQTGRMERKLEGGHTQSVNDAVFSPDGGKVLTVSDDGTARLWEASSGQLLPAFGKQRQHEQGIRSAAFSRNGKRILTASSDGTAKLWSADRGELLRVLKGHTQAVLTAVLSENDRRVLTGSEDNTARLWDAETGAELPFRLAGHTSGVTSVAFSPDGKRAITGSRDTTAKVWDAETGKEILTLKGHLQEVTTVAFSPDEQSVLTGSLDGKLILWLAVRWRKEPLPEPTIRSAAHKVGAEDGLTFAGDGR